MSKLTFYEELNNVFEKLFDKYGFEDDIIQYKQCIISAYQNENCIRNEYILNKIKPKTFLIDKNGNIKNLT